MNYITRKVEECAFEPESTEIRCDQCEKPTGVMGTCQDIGFCVECRADYVAVIGEKRFSEMLITMIEGKSYSTKYARKRVLHFSVDGKPACKARGGPHPLTTNQNDSNCKRCLRAIQK